MKKVIRTAAMIALMLGTLTGTANEGKLSLISNAESSSIVFESDAYAGETIIKLYDADQNIIYFENIGKAAFAKKFDLKNLNDGTYYFMSEDALKTMTYTIQVKGKSASIIDKVENLKPIFKKENGMVYLNLLNLDKTDVNIEVLDSSNRLVFSEIRKNEMIIEKAINFKNAFKDSYTVVVKYNNKSYFEDVLVK